MLSIGQFSKTCMVTVKALHHYDKIGLLHPYHIDEFTGYRYYDESQISMMLLIGRLKRYGFSLSEIKDIISSQNNKDLISSLKEQKNKLQIEISATQAIIGELEAHLHDFERTGDIMGYQNNYQVTLEEIEDIAVLSSRQKMSVDEFGKYYGVLYEKVAKENIETNGLTMAIYHDEEFRHECNDTEVALGVKDAANATRILKGGLCAVTIHHGGYSGLSDAYGAITKWILNEGYKITNSPFEIYIKTQIDKLPPEQWETKIFFPVSK